MLKRVLHLAIAAFCVHRIFAAEPADSSSTANWTTPLAARPLDVFVSGTEGYHTFRIPSIILTKRGTLLAFCEGRVQGRSDSGNIDLVMRRSTDAGQTWSKLQVVWDDGNNTCGNPTPVLDETTGRMWLALTWNFGSDSEDAIKKGESRFPRRVFLTYSDDDGRTWASPTEMPDLRQPHWRWYATGPDKGIQLTRGAHRGRLVIPCNHSDHQDPAKHPYRSHVIYSDDHGKIWKIGGILDEKTNESTLVELADGSIMDNMRSYHGRHRRAVAISRDGGESWGEVTLDETLIEPVCQASMLRVSWPGRQPGRIAFSNPASEKREHLTLRVSNDDGKTWAVSRQIYSGSSAYSSLTMLDANRVGVLFERDNYARITLAQIDLKAEK
jgi:sialidase-1